jgi:hypothetical protein
MSSAKQIEANRRNAQKSKGPRTAAGKAHASCNSRKHALSTISRNNSLFAPWIESIARAICPETANSGLWEQALIIGECATVLGCVQAERIALIEQCSAAPPPAYLMLKVQGELNRGRPSASAHHCGMNLKPWASPHGTLIGSNAMNAGRYHAASGPSRLCMAINHTP